MDDKKTIPTGKKLSNYHKPDAKRGIMLHIIQSDGSPLKVILDRENLPPGFSVTENASKVET